MQVRDAGTGIPADKQNGQNVFGGVGVRGMRERISQLGGSLEIHSDRNGTIVSAKIPVLKAVAANIKATEVA